ncbi:hypothetical protein HPB50_006748 [Hyalomma asiaticum]|uniref:Uncharacterized protein n=1 Tax=Hyalomma asiaticum TaxID=266040 RepID=A0ACB7TFX7_HYAAI|nr:hypothetical protein HPB50_006748 [Hyalomma asiaticum]
MPATVEVEGMDASQEELDDAGWITAASRSQAGAQKTGIPRHVDEPQKTGPSGTGRGNQTTVRDTTEHVVDPRMQALEAENKQLRRDIAELKASFEAFKAKTQGEPQEAIPLWNKAKRRATPPAEEKIDSTEEEECNITEELTTESLQNTNEKEWRTKVDTTLTKVLRILSSMEKRIIWHLNAPGRSRKVGRRVARARAIIRGIRNRDATFFVDAAEYHCETAFAVAVVDGGGNPITTATIRTNSVSVAEEAAIALALQAATTPATIYSDSRTAVRAFSAGTVSSLAARIVRASRNIPPLRKIVVGSHTSSMGSMSRAVSSGGARGRARRSGRRMRITRCASSTAELVSAWSWRTVFDDTLRAKVAVQVCAAMNPGTPPTAEGHAISEALAHYTQPGSSPKAVHIFTDSQQVIQTLQARSKIPAYARRILNYAAQLQQRSIRVRIHWIPGHTNIPGNDLVHQRALQHHSKEQLEDDSSKETATPFQDDTHEANYRAKVLRRRKLRAKLEEATKHNAPPPGSIRLYEITMRRLQTQSFTTIPVLHKMYPTTYCDPNCVSCQVPATMEHILWECPIHESSRAAFTKRAQCTLPQLRRDEAETTHWILEDPLIKTRLNLWRNALRTTVIPCPAIARTTSSPV